MVTNGTQLSCSPEPHKAWDCEQGAYEDAGLWPNDFDPGTRAEWVGWLVRQIKDSK